MPLVLAALGCVFLFGAVFTVGVFFCVRLLWRVLTSPVRCAQAAAQGALSQLRIRRVKARLAHAACHAVVSAGESSRVLH